MGPAKRVVAFSGVAIPQRTIYSGLTKGQRIHVEVDDNTHMLSDFGDVTFAYLDGTFCMLASRGPRMEFLGSAGVLSVAGARDAEFPLLIYKHDPEVGIGGWMQPEGLSSLRRGDWTLAKGVEHLADCILNDDEPVISAEHARHVLEIMFKAAESVPGGRTLDWETSFSTPPPLP